MGPQRARRARGRRSRRHRREMCPEEGGAAGLGELRSWWEVPAIAHFCSLFRTAFRLPDFEIEVSGRARRPFSLPRGASGIPRGRERRRPQQRAGRGRAARTGRRAGVWASDVAGRPPRAPPLLRRGGAGGGRAGGARFCGSGIAALLGAVGAASQLPWRIGVPGEAGPHGGGAWPARGGGDWGPSRSCGAAEGKFRTRCYLIAPFLSERTALVMRALESSWSRFRHYPSGRSWRRRMAPARPKVLSRPRLCDSRAQTRVLAAGLVAGVWSGWNRVAKTRSYTGVLLSFIIIFGRGCEIFDWLAG